MIDDDEGDHIQLRRALADPIKQLGWELHSQYSLVKGLVSVCEIEPHVILLDLTFHPENLAASYTMGLIKDLARKHCVVVFTGREDEATWRDCIAKGAECYIQKSLYLLPDAKLFLVNAIVNSYLCFKRDHPHEES